MTIGNIANRYLSTMLGIISKA